MSLTTYTKKRDFKKTPEPAGKGISSSNKLSFVIQRHDASHLHYDFRLELDGVLKSWAVPKGPSLNPKEKRLAIQVEDHPLTYGKFEGTIPAGNYGAGTVEIWDKGTYTADPHVDNDTPGLRKGLHSGALKFVLHGEKLKGSFALVRLKDGKDKNWLLIKHRDEYATEKDIVNAKAAPKKAVTKLPLSVRSSHGRKKLTKFIAPMLATLTDKPFNDPDWIFEVKWDGYRAIAEIQDKDVKLYSRNGLSFLDLYPEVATALKKIKRNVVFDGEIVVLDKDGKPSFQKLQQYGEDRNHPIQYYIFDCLSVDGKDITDLSLVERKKILHKLIPDNEILKYSEHIEEDGMKFSAEAKKLNLEGVIGKRADSVYEPGRRTTNWLKVKNQNTQEAVIAGYTAPRASRKYFGALILGMYQKGKLKYIGHTGTGYTEKVLKEVYGVLQPLIVSSSPFTESVPVNTAVTWVDPKLVCNVKYSELTQDGIMRHPVFMGLRIDKSPKEVDHLDNVMKTVEKKSSAKKRNVSTPSKDGAGKTIKANGHDVKITNPQKVFWPDEGFTKGDVVDYYNKVSTYILPYLKDRPQSLKRNPNGIVDKGFFHKDAGDAAPDWVKHVEVVSESTGKTVDYILCNNKATLLYLSNLGCIEINPWNSKIKKPDHPDYLIMDIDPSDKNSFNEVIDVALVIKEILDQAGATGYCKTSGATGIHIYIPLHAAYTYDQARPFAELIAMLVVEQLPRISTMERSLSKRNGRIYVDYLQNSRGQTLSSVYSVRPVPGATVSTPLLWKEVKHGLDPRDFTMQNIHKRLTKTGDLFSGVLTDRINLVKCLTALEGRHGY